MSVTMTELINRGPEWTHVRRPSGEYVPEIKVTRCWGAIEKSYEHQGFVWKPQDLILQKHSLGPWKGEPGDGCCRRPLCMEGAGGQCGRKQEAERVVTFTSLSAVIGQILVQNRKCKAFNCSFSGILSFTKPEGTQPALTSHKHDPLSPIPSFLSSSHFNPEK